MDTSQIKENKMGIMPVKRLLITMSVPMMISMLVQALYNIVDSIFVARISEDALTAVSLAFAAQNFIIGINTGTGVGVNALLAKTLGEKNYDRANKVAGNSIFLAFAGYCVIAVLGLCFSTLYFTAQTDDPEIISMGARYLMICSVGSFGIFAMIAFEKLLQATGRTMYTMVSQFSGAAVNIVLDPILIFGYFGFPAMGIAGAAYATAISQVLGGVLAAIFHFKFNHDVKIRLKTLRPDPFLIKKIYTVGLPSIVMASIGSVMNFGLNWILIQFSTTATAVLGVYIKLQSFFFMPVFGLNNGMVPVVAYNYGARNKKRMLSAIKFSMVCASTIMLVGLVVMVGFPGELLKIFEANENMLEIGVPALRIISLSFIFAGFNVIVLSVCQALGHGVLSLIVSVVRQMVIILPMAFILSRIGGLYYTWFAYPIAEIVSLVLCLIFLRRIYTREIKHL